MFKKGRLFFGLLLGLCWCNGVAPYSGNAMDPNSESGSGLDTDTDTDTEAESDGLPSDYPTVPLTPMHHSPSEVAIPLEVSLPPLLPPLTTFVQRPPGVEAYEAKTKRLVCPFDWMKDEVQNKLIQAMSEYFSTKDQPSRVLSYGNAVFSFDLWLKTMLSKNKDSSSAHLLNASHLYRIRYQKWLEGGPDKSSVLRGKQFIQVSEAYEVLSKRYRAYEASAPCQVNEVLAQVQQVLSPAFCHTPEDPSD